MFYTDGITAWWQQRPPGWHGLYGGVKEIPQSDEFSRRKEHLFQALDPIMHRVEEQLRRGPVWILVDGPQGAGKTKTLGPTLQNHIRALHGWTPEAVCTNLALRSRSERHALSATEYQDVWRWYRFEYLKDVVENMIVAQWGQESSFTLTHWYNRERGGIEDETPRVMPVSPLMILEGIGALSDDIITIFQKSGMPYIGLVIDAPREVRYAALLATRTYRSTEDQYQLMNTVEASYWQHFPAIRKNASYSIFVAGDDVRVIPIV